MNLGIATQRPPAHALPRPNEACWCGSGDKYKKCHKGTDSVEARSQGARLTGPRVKPGVVSPRREVPPHILAPDYARSGRPGPDRDGALVLTPEQLVRMRRACRAAAQVLEHTAKAVRPGVTTDALDAIAHEEYLRLGGYPSTLNYHGYPKSLCTSVNEVICHGIPDSRALADGDIVNLDITIYLDGMHGDCSATYLVGEVDEASRKLVRVTEECLARGIAAVKPGLPVRVIGEAIEAHATANGLGVVRAYCGHGIGERFHNALHIPHYVEPDATALMEPGMTFTIEPMLTLGHWHHRAWDDGWTAVTADGSRSAQFEHTLVVTEAGAEVLTIA